MSSALDIAVSTKAGTVPVTILRLKGQLDASTQQALESKSSELIDGGATVMLLDMSEVTYMGSAGLRAMMSIATKLNAKRPSAERFANLKLLTPSADVRKVLKTLGFDVQMKIFDGLDQAVASF